MGIKEDLIDSLDEMIYMLLLYDCPCIRAAHLVEEAYPDLDDLFVYERVRIVRNRLDNE